MDPRDIAVLSATVPDPSGDVLMICYPASLTDTVVFISEVRSEMNLRGLMGVTVNSKAKDGQRGVITIYRNQ